MLFTLDPIPEGFTAAGPMTYSLQSVRISTFAGLCKPSPYSGVLHLADAAHNETAQQLDCLDL
jgi:hypothetical protein